VVGTGTTARAALEQFEAITEDLNGRAPATPDR